MEKDIIFIILLFVIIAVAVYRTILGFQINSDRKKLEDIGKKIDARLARMQRLQMLHGDDWLKYFTWDEESDESLRSVEIFHPDYRPPLKKITPQDMSALLTFSPLKIFLHPS